MPLTILQDLYQQLLRPCRYDNVVKVFILFRLYAFIWWFMWPIYIVICSYECLCRLWWSWQCKWMKRWERRQTYGLLPFIEDLLVQIKGKKICQKDVYWKSSLQYVPLKQLSRRYMKYENMGWVCRLRI